MRGFDDIVRQTVEAVHSYDVSKDDEIVITEINAIIGQLNGKNLTGAGFDDYAVTDLSRIAGSLAIYKTSLGDMIARYQRNLKATEHAIKVRKALLRDKAIDHILDKKISEGKKNARPTVAEIDAFLEKQTHKENSIAIFREELYTKALYLWRSINSLLDVISQHIRIMSSDRTDTRFYGDDLGLDISELQAKVDDKIRSDEEQGI